MIYKIAAIIAALCVWVGVVGPYMISSESDALVLSWIVLSFIGVVYAINRAYKWLTSKDQR